MTEESLQALHMNELLDIMVKSVNELLVLNKNPHDKISIKTKMNEVELIQKAIAFKREKKL